MQLLTTAINYGLEGGGNSFVHNTAQQVTQEGCGISSTKSFEVSKEQKKYYSQTQPPLPHKRSLSHHNREVSSN